MAAGTRGGVAAGRRAGVFTVEWRLHCRLPSHCRTPIRTPYIVGWPHGSGQPTQRWAYTFKRHFEEGWPQDGGQACKSHGLPTLVE